MDFLKIIVRQMQIICHLQLVNIYYLPQPDTLIYVAVIKIEEYCHGRNFTWESNTSRVFSIICGTY